MDLDPATSLAFTLQSNPRSYALLLGAGVSKGAVLTGWEILMDLVTQVADTEGIAATDAEQRYTDNFGLPRYDELLGRLTRRPSERVGFAQAVLRSTR